MNTRPDKRFPVEKLRAAAAAYQNEHIISHCPTCAQPCCRLDKLVLELEWKQVKVLWRIEEARAAFDQRLAAGRGPVEIRPANGLYYIHSKPCPAYDETQKNCRVYDQPVKPAGCSDFPVYDDGKRLVADLRCEAVDLDALTAAIAQALGPDYRIRRSADRDFPFLVSLTVQASGGQPPGKPSRARRGRG